MDTVPKYVPAWSFVGSTVTVTMPVETGWIVPVAGDTDSQLLPEFTVALAVKFCAAVPRFEITMDCAEAETAPCVEEKIREPGLRTTGAPGFAATLIENRMVSSSLFELPLTVKRKAKLTLKVYFPAWVGVPLMALKAAVKPAGNVEPGASV